MGPEQKRFVRYAMAGAAIMLMVVIGAGSSVYFGGDFQDQQDLAVADCMMNQGYGAWVTQKRIEETPLTLEEFCGKAIGTGHSPGG